MTPHQKIMRAAKRGKPLRLLAREVRELSRDGAIIACAENDDERDRLESAPAEHPPAPEQKAVSVKVGGEP